MRIDKYEPKAGGFRALLAADTSKTGGEIGDEDAAIGVGLNSTGKVVAGAGNTGVLGVLVLTKNMKAGDVVDVMTDGEIVEAGGTAGTVYYADPSDGTITDTPPDAAAATLDTGVIADDNALTWTSRDLGAAGNDVTVTLEDPGANGSALAVDVVGNDITVSLATDGGGAITTTGDQLKAAIAADADANALVTVADTGASDGSGVVDAEATASLSGGDDALRVGHTVEAGRLVVRVRR